MSDREKVFFTSDAEIEALVARFVACELPPDDVSHRVHVAMSAWSFLTLPAGEAAARVHDDLVRYVAWHQITIYNETITQFWARLIGKEVATADRTRPAFAVVNEITERLGDSRLIFAYYTRERLQSDEARHQWVEPDLQPLDD
ncbi:MAG TPA: hypothetical protein VKA60_27390 [Blastocatellia bacterium]|nr:hypothetical protein [Blastocatellia bacterium]